MEYIRQHIIIRTVKKQNKTKQNKTKQNKTKQNKKKFSKRKKKIHNQVTMVNSMWADLRWAFIIGVNGDGLRSGNVWKVINFFFVKKKSTCLLK